MGVSTTSNRISYTGNGATVAFAFPYKFLLEADLVVKKRLISDGTETDLVLTTDYTVVGEGEDAGGTVTLLAAPSSLYEVVIYNDPAITQEVNLEENDASPAEVQEGGLDRLTLISQRLKDRVDRAVRLSDGFAPTFDPTFPGDLDDSAGKVPLVNSSGDGWADAADWPVADDITQLSADLAAAEAAAAASASSAATSASGAATSASAAAASAAAAAAGIAAHEADTTNIHGIVDTADIVLKTGTQVITGQKSFDLQVPLKEIASPATPAAGYLSIYAKSDHVLYKKDSTGSEVPIGSGGGGVIVLWDELANAPTRDVENSRAVHLFVAALAQELYMDFKVPASYVAGKPIALLIKAYSPDSSGTMLMRAQSTLVRKETDDVASVTNQRTTTNAAITLDASNDSEDQQISLDITSSIGQINAVSVAPGDSIGVRLYRDTDTATSDIRFLNKQCEVTLQ